MESSPTYPPFPKGSEKLGKDDTLHGAVGSVGDPWPLHLPHLKTWEEKQIRDPELVAMNPLKAAGIQGCGCLCAEAWTQVGKLRSGEGIVFPKDT